MIILSRIIWSLKTLTNKKNVLTKTLDILNVKNLQ